MSHRVIIINKVAEIFDAPEVKEELTPAQQTRAHQIFQHSPSSPIECPDEDFHWLMRKLTKVYCQED